MKFASSIMNSIARLLILLTALLGLAGTACAQNTWEVSPTDVESNRRGLAGIGVGRPALDSWEADAGTLVFHAEPTGTTVTFSCGTKEARTYRNDVSILVYSDEACTQQVTSGFVRSGNTVVTANPISQAGTFYCILASPDGGGTTYFRHTFGINVKAAPVVPVKTGLQLTPPTTAQLPGGSFTILVKATDANGNTTIIDGSSSAVTWTFDSNVFTRSGARFTVKSTAATSSQTISAIYNGLGGSCTVQVNKPTITSLSLTGVPIVAQTVGKSFTPILTATMSAGPSVKIPASTPGLIWNVNPSILSISNGVVSVLSGTVDSTPLSVQAVGIESNVVNVLIKKLPPTLTGIIATPSSTTLAPGGSFTPGLALTYSDNTAKTISPTQTGLTWKFDATIFVRNSSTGAFTLKSSSTATAGNLTATYSGKSVGIAVAIARAPFVTGIALDPIPAQPRGTTTAPTTFTTVVKKLLSDGSSAVISDATLTCDSAVFTVKTQGQIQVKPTSTATSGTVTARFGTFSDTKTIAIVANAPVPKAIKAVNLVVPTFPLQPGASFTPTVDITWADGTKTTSNLATAGIPYSFDPYSLTPGTAGLLTVLSSTKSTLGKITLTPPTLQPKTAYVRITQSVVPQKSFITSHVNGAIFGASSGTFTATMVTADRVTLRVILNDDTFIDSKSFSPGQIPSITVSGLPLIRSRIKVQATSYYNGNMGSDLLGMPANDIVELYPRAFYPAPVTGCVGANTFVLDAFGIPSGTILTPYSLYQFFETFGVARQRASSEVGTLLLSTIPDGAIVFFLDPSMSLSWNRPQSNDERSVIVSRKAYGDAGIWDAATQTILYLNGGNIASDDLLTTYDGYGTGANFTARFVYGWVTAADFISTYSVAAAEAFQASDLGEVNFGVLANPDRNLPGRYATANQTRNTPAVPISPLRLSADFITKVQTCLDCYEAAPTQSSGYQYPFIAGRREFLRSIGVWQPGLPGKVSFTPGANGGDLAGFVEEKHPLGDFIYAAAQAETDFFGGLYEGVLLNTVQLAIDAGALANITNPSYFLAYSLDAFRNGTLNLSVNYNEFLTDYVAWQYSRWQGATGLINDAKEFGRTFYSYNPYSGFFKVGEYSLLIRDAVVVFRQGVYYFLRNAEGKIFQITEKYAQKATSIVNLGDLKLIRKGVLESPAGLIYAGKGSDGLTRVDHILKHLTPNPLKKTHTVFKSTPEKLFGLIDEAWLKKGAREIGNSQAYVVDMGRVIGTNGETKIRIVTEIGTELEIVTAYPLP